MFSKLSSKKNFQKLNSNKEAVKKVKHTFRVIPAEEINENRSKAYTYLV